MNRFFLNSNSKWARIYSTDNRSVNGNRRKFRRDIWGFLKFLFLDNKKEYLKFIFLLFFFLIFNFNLSVYHHPLNYFRFIALLFLFILFNLLIHLEIDWVNIYSLLHSSITLLLLFFLLILILRWEKWLV